MDSPTFSVIIPHFNSPKLLVRAINSVPPRDDLEVIVVDNSPVSIDASNLSGTTRPYKLIYSSKTLGAGCARNVGLDNARGTYIIFMDADDFMSEDTDGILDDFINMPDKADITYYRCAGVFSDTLKPSSRADIYNKHFTNYIKSPDAKHRERLSYYHLVPWAKIYKRAAIDRAKARFDEIPASNDLMFATKVAVSTNNIHAYDKCLYYVTSQSAGTLTTSPNPRNIRSRYNVVLRQSKLFKSVGKLQYSSLPGPMLKALFKCSFKDFCWGIGELFRQRVNPFAILWCKVKYNEYK